MVIALPHTELGQAAHQSLPPAAMPPSLPAGQLVHASDPVLEILPQSHVVHVVEAAALYVPDGHTVQTPAPSWLHSPALQLVQYCDARVLN